MKNSVLTIGIDQLVYYPTQVKELNPTFKECLERPLKRTCKKPVNLIIAVPILDPETPDLYWVISGRTALELLLIKGYSEVEALVYHITDESQIMDLISDLEEQNGQNYCDLFRDTPLLKEIETNNYTNLHRTGKQRKSVKKQHENS